MLRKILNTRGFSLMEMVVGAALTGVLSLLIVQQFREQDKFKQTMENDLIVTELRRAFLKGFHNRYSCSNTLRQGRDIIVKFNPGGDLTAIRSGGPHPGKEMYRINVPFDGNRFVIRKIGTTFDNLSGVLLVSVDVEDLRKSPNGLLTALGQRRLLPPIEFEVDVTQEPNTNYFVECSADSPDSTKFCEGPGALYDAVTDECLVMGPDLSQPIADSGHGSKGVALNLFSGMVTLKTEELWPMPGFTCAPKEYLWIDTADGLPKCKPFTVNDFGTLFDLGTTITCSPPNNTYRIKYDGNKFVLECYDGGTCTPVNCDYNYTPGQCRTYPNGCKTGCRIYDLHIVTPSSCGGTSCPPFSHCLNDPTCSETSGYCVPME